MYCVNCLIIALNILKLVVIVVENSRWNFPLAISTCSDEWAWVFTVGYEWGVQRPTPPPAHTQLDLMRVSNSESASVHAKVLCYMLQKYSLCAKQCASAYLPISYIFQYIFHFIYIYEKHSILFIHLQWVK